MQECFGRFPTVYNKTGDDESGETSKDAASNGDGDVFGSLDLSDGKNTVETVDQLDEPTEEPKK